MSIIKLILCRLLCPRCPDGGRWAFRFSAGFYSGRYPQFHSLFHCCGVDVVRLAAIRCACDPGWHHGAMTVPAAPKYDTARFSEQVRELMNRFDATHQPAKSIMTNDEGRALVQALENGVHKVEAPLQRLEHIWSMPVA